MTFSLARMLKPRRVALIGASADASAVGGRVALHVLAGLTQASELGAQDQSAGRHEPAFLERSDVYLVNPHHHSLYGQLCYQSIDALPQSVDLAILLTPWTAAPGCIEQLARRGVAGIVCVSIATDSTVAGVIWQSRKANLLALRRQLSRLDVALIGPSSFGVQLPNVGLNASLAPGLLQPNRAHAGGLVLLSQSEAASTLLSEYCHAHALGVRALLTLGDTVNVHVPELLDYFAADASAAVVLVALDAGRLAELDQPEWRSSLRACAQRKPTVLWCAQTGVEFARAEAIAAALGALCVQDFAAFSQAAQLCQLTRLAAVTQNLNVLANGVALLSMAEQAAQLAGFALPPFAPKLARRLKLVLTAKTVVQNPLNLGRDAGAKRYAQVANALLGEADAPQVGPKVPTDDALTLFCHHPNSLADAHAISAALCVEIGSAPTSGGAPLKTLAVLTGAAQTEARALLMAHGVPAFADPQTAIAALLWQKRWQSRAPAVAQAAAAQPPATELLTAGGLRLLLRDIQPADEPALQRGFMRLSAEEVRMRFMYPLKALTQELAAKLSNLDPHREIALVCASSEPPGAATLYAVARASRLPSYAHRLRFDAEFAIVLPRALSGQGLGQRLMQALMQRCGASGVKTLWGDVLAENAAMLALARKLGFEIEKHPSDAHLVRVTRRL